MAPGCTASEMSDSDLLDSNDVQYDSEDDYGYGSDDVEIDAAAGEPRAGSASQQALYTVISLEQLQTLQDESLESVQSILGCNPSVARALLIYYQWDAERLFGTLAERGEEWVYRAAGVTNPNAAPPQAQGCSHITCGTCFCDVPVADTTAMDCGHAFCNECWRGHFKVQISEGKSRRLTCMGVKCDIICDERKVLSVLAGGSEHSELADKYKNSLLESYIEDNKRVKWCPSRPHCGNAVRVEGDETHLEPECLCGERFCFHCGLEPHSPCTCEMWHAWKHKCADDSETNNWISANTKPCPKCSKPVEKNQGCNLVVCMCGQAFCWLCGQATGREHTWTSITGHSCGRWKDEADKRVDQGKRQLERYLHYYRRYQGHLDSRKHEARARQQAADKIATLEGRDTDLKDYSWLMQALEQLCDTRSILGYSYAFAYYMFGGELYSEEISPEQNDVNKNLFEDQQQQLEAEAERLSHLINTPEAAMTDTVRLSIINSATNVERRVFNLYKLIENELLGQLQVSPNDIAPYKGISTLQAELVNDRLAAAAAAAAMTAQGAAAAAAGGPSTSRAASASAAGPSGAAPAGLGIGSNGVNGLPAAGARRSGRYRGGGAGGAAAGAGPGAQAGVDVVDLTMEDDDLGAGPPAKRQTRSSTGKRPATGPPEDGQRRSGSGGHGRSRH